jgi:hypothetical protein
MLAVLQFGGPIVGLISALWSTTQKITYEAENGVKRLTRQGRVLIAIIAVSGLISLGALGLETVLGKQRAQREAGDAEKKQAESDRLSYPLRSIAAAAEISLNFEGVDMTGFWKEIEANEGLERRSKSHYRQNRIVILRRSDFSSAPRYRDRLDYATTGTKIRLDFESPEPASNRPAGSGSDEIRRIEAPTSMNGRVSVAFKFEMIKADLDDRTITAYFGGKYVPEVPGVVDGGDKLSTPEVKKLVPILTIRRNLKYKREPDTLVHVLFNLDDFGQFDASQEFKIADKGSFILGWQPPRR